MSTRTEYFRKFPLIIYNNEMAVNIMRRVDFNSKLKGFYTAFYDVDLKEGERVETLAHDYYDDIDLDWLIYHTNDIIDPYNDVPLEDSTLLASIKQKHGSIEKAQRKVFVYRNNYRSDISVLTSGSYDALASNHKKYYDIVSSVTGITGYQRKESDEYASTNMIISYSFTGTVSNTFNIGELVNFTSGSKSGTATVAAANNTYVLLQHISGDWSTMTTDFNVIGEDSQETIEFNYDTYNLIKNVIPADEQIYFSPYYYFDYEVESNEQKRKIYLIDDNYKTAVNDQLDELMK